MDLRQYQTILSGLSYGKRLPSAVYLYHAHRVSSDSRPPAREEFSELAFIRGSPLLALVSAAAERCQIGHEFNVLKFRTDELKLSFLSYTSVHTLYSIEVNIHQLVGL
jgi:hypothetical protein